MTPLHQYHECSGSPQALLHVLQLAMPFTLRLALQGGTARLCWLHEVLEAVLATLSIIGAMLHALQLAEQNAQEPAEGPRLRSVDTQTGF